MINILRSITLTLIGLASMAWLSIYLIADMYGLIMDGPSPDGTLTDFFSENIIMTTQVSELGYEFADVAQDLFLFTANMHVTLLVITAAMAISWSVASHYLNIDSPGKAKIYFIHWIVFSSILEVILLGVILYCLTATTNWNSIAEFIGDEGTFWFCLSSLYYFLMYFVAVLLGTARFARSSVLLANKLPGGF